MAFKDIDHEMTEENKSAFDSVNNALYCSEEHGMEANVMYYALMFLKTNPSATIQDAIDALMFLKTNPSATIQDAIEFGLDEWLK